MRTLCALLAVLALSSARGHAAFVWTGNIEHEVRLIGGGPGFPGILSDHVTFDWYYFTAPVAGDYIVTMTPQPGTGTPNLMYFDVYPDGVPLFGTRLFRSSIMALGRSDTVSLAPGDYILKLTTEEDEWDSGDGIIAQFSSEKNSHGAYQVEVSGPASLTEIWEGNLDDSFTITQIPEPAAPLLVMLGLLVGAGRRRAQP